MKIDFHVHAFPDKVAAKALPKLAAASGLRPTTDGTLSGARAYAEAHALDKVVLLNVAETPAQMAKANAFALDAADDRVLPFAALHPLAPDWSYELEKAAERGARGVKLHPEYQLFDMGDRAVYPFYDAVLSQGMILLFHAGFDPAFPESRRGYPGSAAQVVRDFPGGKIALAHMGNCLDLGETERELGGLPVWMDISMCHKAIDPARAAAFIRAHGPRYFLFGTDTPWGGYEETQDWLGRMNLNEKTVRGIMGENAAELLGI